MKSKMRLVKLDNRHKLFKEGYSHAFRFTSYGDESRSVERTFERVIGPQYSRDNWCNTRSTRRWTTQFGKARSSGEPRPYWIGCYSDDAMMVQLAL